MNKILKFIWILVGIVSFILGTIGIVLPILPTVPFYLFTVFCFSKGSDKLHSYFISSKFYQKHLKHLSIQEGMTLKTKLYLSWIVFTCLSVSFYFARKSIITEIIIVLVWIVQVLFFIFKIKTIK